MKKSPLSGLVIRTGVALGPQDGFIYACDLKKERKGIPHTIIFRWNAGEFEQGECEYNAHSACNIHLPEVALVDISESGYYTFNSERNIVTEDIFENSWPPPTRARSRGIRAVSEICGKAYAVGIRGMVYRLDQPTRWARMDEGLPESFDAQAIHGFADSDLYAVGRHGELWQCRGGSWIKRELPTNRNLTAVKCASDGVVYVAGYGGMLLRGREDMWEVIEQEETSEDIWDIECFDGTVYISTMDDVYRLLDDRCEAVSFGKNPPKSCYQLSVADGVLWSVGEHDIRSFDGTDWAKIV